MRICCTIKSARLFRNFLSVVDTSTFYFVSEFAINQNASINKNSKSSNSRNLKQHTFAKSISLCCFCFCFVRKIDRFIILICRYLSHQFDKIFNKILIKIFIFVILYFLFSLFFFCFRIYFFTFIAFVLKLSTSIMFKQIFESQSTNFFAMSIDRRNE